MINWKKYLLVFAMFFVFWFSLLISSKSLFSGFHLTDDHQVLEINKDFENGGKIIEITEKWARKDLVETRRFRPVYIVHRVLETKFFGSNFIAWSIYNSLLAVFTSFLLFLFLKIINFSFFEATAFSFLTILGPHASVWWRLGPAETIGMFLFSLTLFFLALSIRVKKRRYTFFFILFLILMSLVKESFIFLIPAVLFLVVWLNYRKNGSWVKSIKQNFLSIFVILLLAIFEIIFIKFFIKTSGIGYAGIYRFSPMGYLLTLLSFLRVNSYYILAFIEVLALSFLWTKSKYKVRPYVKDFLLLCFFCVLIIFPQVVLYGESGIFGRYFIPTIFGYSFFIIFSINLISKILGLKNEKSVILPLLCLFFLIPTVFSVYASASDFAKDGININNFFRSVDKNVKKEKPTLVVGDPAENFEHIESVGYFLNDELKIKKENLYFYALLRKSESKYGDFERALIKGAGAFYGKNKYESIERRENINSIIVFPRLEKKFIENMSNDGWFNKDLYNRNNFDNYVIYYKK